MMIWLSRFSLLLAVSDFIFLIYLVMYGFPPQIAGSEWHLKNMRKPFVALVLLVLLTFIFHPDRKNKINLWKEKAKTFASHPYAIWILFFVYCFLFLWQQLTEYFSIDINFIPFGFYDYILYYFFQGKVNFTGLLHGFYHLNNIMIFLAPLWFLFRNSLFLVVIYGFTAAAAILPLHGIAKERFQTPFLPFLIAFLYLNYRYLQNVLLMNFSVEIFYPLFIFSALYAALRSRWILYYGAVGLGLLVKEDSFIYFSALGLLLLFMKHPILSPHGKERDLTLVEPRRISIPVRKFHGVSTILLSVLYFIFLIKVFIPWTGNTILKGDIENFGGFGESVENMFVNLLKNPLIVFGILFGSAAKLRTYLNLLSRLLFLPLLSPSAVLILAPLFPLFFHATGRDSDFVDLRFHYAAAVIPFVFIAFIFGFSNLCNQLSERRKEVSLWAIGLILVMVNGGNYVSRPITLEHRKSIQYARSVPPGANLVTHGHLLPYVGYRKYNYYFALPFEITEHPAHEPYVKADYYLIDFNVNWYPMNKSYLENKLAVLKSDPAYQLMVEDGERYLFKRKDYRVVERKT